MEIKERLKICIVHEGKISREIPEDFEWLFLKHYMKSNGWMVSGAAFAGNNDLILWRKEEECKTLQELLPSNGIAPEVRSLIQNCKQWFEMEISVVLKTIIQ